MWPLAVRAQAPRRIATVGFLGTNTPSVQMPWTAAFVQRLRELNWTEGRDVTIEYRWAEGRTEQFTKFASEFARLKVDVIVTSGTPATLAAKRATSIPVVFALSSDPVGSGLVAKDDELKGFAIAGKDRKFVNAYAKIEGDKVVVSHPEVQQPVAVRYGWANYPLGNLWNKDGLLASPFRTDDFPMITAPKQ